VNHTVPIAAKDHLRVRLGRSSAAELLDAAAGAVLRYGLVAILLFFGAFKFTAAEANGIQPLIANSPFLFWLYSVGSVRSVSNGIGTVELAIALLIATRRFAPGLSALGSLCAAGMFAITLTFLFSTPGAWVSVPGFPLPVTGEAGAFLIKDVFLFGAAFVERRGVAPRKPAITRSVVAAGMTWLRQRLDRDDWALLPLRLMVGFGFAAHGYAKLARGPASFAVILAAMGVPAPSLSAWAASLLEFAGGLLLMAGAFVVPLSLPLGAIMAVAMFAVHARYGFSSIRLKAFTVAGAEFGPVGYEIDLLYIAGLLTLALSGSTPFSVDRRLEERRRRLNEGVASAEARTGGVT